MYVVSVYINEWNRNEESWTEVNRAISSKEWINSKHLLKWITNICLFYPFKTTILIYRTNGLSMKSEPYSLTGYVIMWSIDAW